jgi:hypothetical protein
MSRKPISLRLLLAAGTPLAALPALAHAQTPPARVGQVSYLSGSVSFNGAGSNGQWVAAAQNYPVSGGDALFTQDGAEAAVAVDASRLTLGPDTELQINSLDDENFAATVSQGEVFLTLNALQPGQNFSLTTPGGQVSISQAGEYDVVAGNSQVPPSVTVLAGYATVGVLSVGAGQSAVYTQGGMQLEAAQRDGFIDHVLAEMAPPPPPYVPPVVSQMTGVSELSNYGNWDQDSDYGAVWYPSVPAGWAPYRDGHWAYIAPWGWTWVDNAPWGFAPFHYGRWIDHGGRWGWVPAGDYDRDHHERPVYAPALVGFFGVGAAGITVEALSRGSVGWVPLGPGEAYYPGYRTDPRYVERLNHDDVRDFHADERPRDFGQYEDRRAATYVPADAMSHGYQVQRYEHAVPQDMYHQVTPVHGGFNQDIRPDQREMAHTQAPPEVRQVNPGEVQRPQDYHPQAPQQYHQQQMDGYQPQMPRVETPNGTQNYRPQEPSRPAAPQVYRPQEPAQVYRPQEPAQVYRPQQPAQAYHPQPAQEYHPQPAEQFHPQPAQEFHPPPAPVFHPQQEQNRGGGEMPRPDNNHDEKKKN